MSRILARPPVGTRSQEKSLTAVAAFIASRLAGVGVERRASWLQEARLAVGRNGLERAAAHASAAVKPWLLVEESQLGLELEKALVLFPGHARARPELTRFLRQTGALRQLLVMRSRRDVLCVLVFHRDDRDALFESIESTGESFIWEELIEDDRTVESAMWRALMQRAAVREALVRA
jgi:hypothetical protein